MLQFLKKIFGRKEYKSSSTSHSNLFYLRNLDKIKNVTPQVPNYRVIIVEEKNVLNADFKKGVIELKADNKMFLLEELDDMEFYARKININSDQYLREKRKFYKNAVLLFSILQRR